MTHKSNTQPKVAPYLDSTIDYISDKKALALAGTKDLVALLPLPGNPPIIKELGVLEAIAGAVIGGEMCHVHGETGTGKNAVIEAIISVPENWEALCEHLGAPHLPLKVFAVEMSSFETISELYFRRALDGGKTYDEPSCIVQAIREAAGLVGKAYPLIWLREFGRMPTASVQGGLLNLMTKGLARLSGSELVSGSGIAWIADSNYHTDDSSVHVLVVQDDAVNRRWTLSVVFDYLTQEQDMDILRFHKQQGYLPEVPDELIFKTVELGHAIRQQRRNGSLASLAPPTLYGYAAFLRAAHRHPRFSIQEIAEITLLGAASKKDRADVLSLFAEVFGVRVAGRDGASYVGVF